MLVLSRRIEDSIIIGDGIEVKVLGVRGVGDQVVVRLGIVAPREVPVLRAEVVWAVEAENRAAATVSPVALEPWPLQTTDPAAMPDSGNWRSDGEKPR